MAHRLALFFHACSFAGEFDHAPIAPSLALNRIESETSNWPESSIAQAARKKTKFAGACATGAQMKTPVIRTRRALRR
jgi:hypothetical protein